jgi:hypothetical protein
MCIQGEKNKSWDNCIRDYNLVNDKFKNRSWSQVWWCIPVILTLEKLRIPSFEASLCYIMRSLSKKPNNNKPPKVGCAKLHLGFTRMTYKIIFDPDSSKHSTLFWSSWLIKVFIINIYIIWYLINVVLTRMDFFSVLKFELRTFQLLGRHYTTWAMSSSPFF